MRISGIAKPFQLLIPSTLFLPQMSLSDKVYKTYPLMRSVVEELDDRFIIGLDAKVLTDSRLIFFKIQKAFWYYKDHFEKEIKDKKAPGMSLEMFGQLLIEESAVLSRIYPHNLRESKYKEWQDYLKRVPRLGAICINPSLDKVLMIQPFGRNRKCLQFPRGKLHAGEDHVKAAAREVWEECGIRIENLIDDSNFFESVIDTTLHKLYVVYPVMEELVPTIQCNKEIEQILWHPIDELPGWTNLSSGWEDKNFFGVAPFVPMLKNFIKRTRKERGMVGQATISILKRPQVPVQQVLKQKLLPSVTDEALSEGSADDQLNSETFGNETSDRWSFEDMISANEKLGMRASTFDDKTFDAQFSTVTTTKKNGLSIDGDAILRAFIDAWNSK